MVDTSMQFVKAVLNGPAPPPFPLKLFCSALVTDDSGQQLKGHTSDRQGTGESSRRMDRQQSVVDRPPRGAWG